MRTTLKQAGTIIGALAGIFIFVSIVLSVYGEPLSKKVRFVFDHIVSTPTVVIAPTPESKIQPTPAPTSTSMKKLFGPFDWIPDSSKGYTLTRIGKYAEQWEAARAHDVKAFVALTGSRWRYTNENGCFDLQMWKAELDRQDLVNLQPYIDSGTVIGLYAIDEPHDWGCGPTYEELNEACRYAHEKLPGIACGFNTKAWWLEPGKEVLTELDYLFSQTNIKNVTNNYGGSWTAWAAEQFTDAYWFDGPIYLSINAYSYSPTDQQINDAAIELCQTDAAGVMMWKWDYVEGRDLSRAIEFCAGN